MLTALSLALSDSLAPAGRRALLISLAGTLILLAALWLGATALLGVIHASRFHWLDAVIGVVGSLAGLLIAWLLFPATAMFMLGFFIDPFIASIERSRYPELPPARQLGLGEFLGSTLRFALFAVVLNLIMLPAYFLPVIGAAIYFAFNGYVVGRQCFESVALRHADGGTARRLWRQNRGRFLIAGMIVVVLLSIPLVNLIAPLVGVAFMLHLFTQLRHATPANASNRSGKLLFRDDRDE